MGWNVPFSSFCPVVVDSHRLNIFKNKLMIDFFFPGLLGPFFLKRDCENHKEWYFILYV